MLAISGCAFVAATLIMFGAVLPVEFNWDPLGAWPDVRAQSPLGTERSRVRHLEKRSAFKRGNIPMASAPTVIEIPLRAGGDSTRGDELEYKVQMKKDATFVYEWSVADIPNLMNFISTFTVHTLAAGKAMTVATYKQATATSANGALTAPFRWRCMAGFFRTNRRTRW